MDGDNTVLSDGKTSQEGSTRQVILTLLKTKGPCTAGSLAKELAITEMAVRRHLHLLEKEGYVRPRLERQKMGRPSHMYGLTVLADNLFPKNYHALALDLLAEWDENDEQEQGAVTKLFEGRKQKLLRRYAGRMQGKTLEQRVEELGHIQNAGGYMVQVVKSGENELMLNEFNCPIAQVANRYQQACQCELALFRELLETKVERTECLAKDGDKCSYRISLS
ncbi:transcriptional regulator [Paenibacillaceae bacterium]|nr:transcriptional regulator [Paenibacillaceae bacterium]